MKKRRSRGETLLHGAGTLARIATPVPGDVKPGLTPARAMQQAMELQQAGNPGGAEDLYRGILRAYPRHFDALHHLGILKAQGGLLQEALQLINEALRTNPRSAEANLNLGNVLAETGRPEEALVSYDNALAIRPEFAEALYCRGNALQTLKRHEEALVSYDRALAIVPGRAEILGNRGNTLHDLKRYEEALASYDEAIAIMPGAALLHNNRGNTLRALKRLEEALASLDRALAIEPDYVEALNNRGSTLQDLQRYEEALASFDLVLISSPDDAVVHNNRGNVLQDLRRYEEALVSYEKALAIRTEFPEALRGLGNALHKLRRFEAAMACYEKALIIQPDYAEALNSRGNTLLELQRFEEAMTSFENALAIKPDFEYAAGMLAYAKLHCCDWRARNEEDGRLVTAIRAGKRSALPFIALSVTDSPQDQLLCSRTLIGDKFPASPTPFWKGTRYRHDRIRVAYLSADLHEHVMAYCLLGLFETHDQARFETTAVSFGPDVPSETRSRLKEAFSRFVDVQMMSDREVAQLLRDLEIDIAVDLNGFTTDSRTGIFALRAAPVQVNYLGYPGTMGADFIDYIIADRFLIPEQHYPHYSEKVVYLPDTYMASDSRRLIADRTPARAEARLPEQGFVFCSFNNAYKINPMIFDVWMRLLDKVEGSVLWLRGGGKEAMRNLKNEAAHRGIAPERLVLAPKAENIADHLARHRLADLALDTLPYNGHATTSDALWAGLPVVTCLGTTFSGRVAASLLNAIGLNELITHSLEEYEALALELATNPKRLADIKSKLAENRNTFPLFNTDRFRRHIEAAYTTMWERYQRGEPPESFAVEPIDK